jgi:hypothetical protein
MRTFIKFKKDKINEIIHKQLSNLYAQPVNTYNPFSVSNDTYWSNNLVNDNSSLRTHISTNNPYSSDPYSTHWRSGEVSTYGDYNLALNQATTSTGKIYIDSADPFRTGMYTSTSLSNGTSIMNPIQII